MKYYKFLLNVSYPYPVIGDLCYCSVHKENSILMQRVCAVSCVDGDFGMRGRGRDITGSPFTIFINQI